MNTDRETRCYALRRLNPFLGVLQVIETPIGRAVPPINGERSDREEHL